MKLSSFPSDFIWVKITEPVLNAEEDDLTILSLPVELDLLPHSLIETPEHPAPRFLQPVRGVGEVKISLGRTGKVLGPVARASHQARLGLLI